MQRAKMKTTILTLGMLLLLIASVNAMGFGVIVNQDYGLVIKGETYSKDLQTWVMDSDYSPYTNDTNTYDVLVEITSEVDPFVTHPYSTISQVNRWDYNAVILDIPKNAKFGSYETQICAIAINAVTGGIGINVGCCQDIIYEIVPKGQIKNAAMKTQVVQFKNGKLKLKKK